MGVNTIAKTNSARRAVFLDRDGVLNRAFERNGKPHPPEGPAELEVLPGVVEACEALRKAGFLLIVVTNQPDVARGSQSREIVENINAALCARVPIDDVRVCYHDDSDGCSCRKPRPGLVLQAARDWRIDLASSFMVGDRWKDIEAGQRAGCTTLLIDNGWIETVKSVPDRHVHSLLEAAEWILSRRSVSSQGEEL